jgi:hypothetical protein
VQKPPGLYTIEMYIDHEYATAGFFYIEQPPADDSSGSAP